MTHRQFSPIHLFTFPHDFFRKTEEKRSKYLHDDESKNSRKKRRPRQSKNLWRKMWKWVHATRFGEMLVYADRSRCAPTKPSPQATLSRFITLLRLKIARNVAQKNNESPMRSPKAQSTARWRLKIHQKPFTPSYFLERPSVRMLSSFVLHKRSLDVWRLLLPIQHRTKKNATIVYESSKISTSWCCFV